MFIVRRKNCAKAPNKELVFTETSIGEWNDGRNLSRRLIEDMREVALCTVSNGCKAVIVWNLKIDTEKGPNRNGGCQTCYGAVDINKSDYKTITRNSHYYIIGHMSSVLSNRVRHVSEQLDILPMELSIWRSRIRIILMLWYY